VSELKKRFFKSVEVRRAIQIILFFIFSTVFLVLLSLAKVLIFPVLPLLFLLPLHSPTNFLNPCTNLNYPRMLYILRELVLLSRYQATSPYYIPRRIISWNRSRWKGLYIYLLTFNAWHTFFFCKYTWKISIITQTDKDLQKSIGEITVKFILPQSRHPTV